LLAVMLLAPGAAQAAGESISLTSQSGGTYKYQLNTASSGQGVSWKGGPGLPGTVIVLSGLSGVTGASLSGDLAGSGTASGSNCALSVTFTATSVTVSQPPSNNPTVCAFSNGQTVGTLEVDSSVTTAGTVNWAIVNEASRANPSGTVQGPVANTVTVTNPGNQTGTVGTAVSLQIGASDSASGQTLTYSASGLPAGLSINSTSGLISGTPSTAATYNTTVTATDTTGASGNAPFTWTVVPPTPDLAITDQAPSSVMSGNTLTYTITATNSGGLDASGVTVTYPFSGNENLNLVSAKTTQGTCSTKGGTVKCSVGTLPGGSNATITIVAIATKPGTFSNTATVTASNVTGDLDDSFPATTTVIGT
jgi:uncharacterized repeat protein (TIGR01451 family)